MILELIDGLDEKKDIKTSKSYTQKADNWQVIDNFQSYSKFGFDSAAIIRSENLELSLEGFESYMQEQFNVNNFNLETLTVIEDENGEIKTNIKLREVA